MAQHFFLHAADVLIEEDTFALDQILQRKIRGLPKALLSTKSLPLDHIIRGCDPQTGRSLSHFPFETTNVPFGATFAGQLFFRKEIMEYANAKTPLRDWEGEALLAYFSSNVDRNRSFHMYFEETRGRLYECFCDKVSGDGTLLQGAYTLACLEYNKYEGVLDPNRPVRHQEAFITQLQITPNDFTVRTYSMNKRLVQLAHRHIIKLRARHWQNVDEKAKGYLDFLVRPTATEAAPKPKKKRARKSRKGKTAKLADHYNDDVSDEQSPDPSSTAIDPAHQTAPYKTLYYDTERIKACMHDNPLLQALVRYMPGIWSSDSIISIDEEGVYDCFTLIAALDADGDAGMEGNAGDYEEDLVDQLTKKLNIEDDRNIVIFSGL